MTTTIGWILLFTQATYYNGHAEDWIRSRQYDFHSNSPEMFATQEACQQQLQKLVFEEDFPYEVKILKGGSIYAEGFKKGAGGTGFRNRVECLKILDTPN